MPALFVGHGSPMNAIEHNVFTEEWKQLGKKIKPKAILMISAHWYTRGLFVQDEEHPKVINDMYGFPEELYNINYTPKGNGELTKLIRESLSVPVQIRNDWGIDHGAWSVLVHMYPQKDVPVVQVSVNANATPQELYQMGRELRHLRDKGIFIIGSGNIVHNLRLVDFGQQDKGYDWNFAFDNYIKDSILSHKIDNIIDYQSLGKAAQLSVPTPDHLDPLFYVMGATDTKDRINIFNEASIMGSLSMTSYLFE